MKPRSPRHRMDFRKNLVGFHLGEVRYAVGVEEVLQVVNPLPVTVLPQMPRAIVGVAEHRGLVIPVVDLRLYFGMPADSSRRTKWMLLRIDGAVVGLVVDAVTGVFGASEEQLRAAPDLGPGDGRRVLTGVASQEGQMVFLLDAVTLYEIARPAMGASLPAFASMTSREDPELR